MKKIKSFIKKILINLLLINSRFIFLNCKIKFKTELIFFKSWCTIGTVHF